VLDVAPSEFLMIAFVALVVIGPKDLPKAMRVVGYWVGRARGVARQFRSGFDAMVREAELEEMEKRWAAENERIMREHGAGPPEPLADSSTSDPSSSGQAPVDGGPSQPVSEAVSVEAPRVEPASTDASAREPRGDGVTS